jgi:PPOX class probable F420-dependent enzyme
MTDVGATDGSGSTDGTASTGSTGSAGSAGSAALAELAAHKNVRLTTFRRDGRPVATPVWLVRDGQHLVVITGSGTGKVKRIRHTPRVLLAPCDMRGRVAPGAQDVEGSAQLLTGSADVIAARGLIKQRYGFGYTVALFFQRLRGMSVDEGAVLRITV